MNSKRYEQHMVITWMCQAGKPCSESCGRKHHVSSCSLCVETIPGWKDGTACSHCYRCQNMALYTQCIILCSSKCFSGACGTQWWLTGMNIHETWLEQTSTLLGCNGFCSCRFDQHTLRTWLQNIDWLSEATNTANIHACVHTESTSE